MFDRPGRGERAVLVHLESAGPSRDEHVAELTELAKAAGADVVSTIVGRADRPHPATFAGSGKVVEIAAAVAASEADLVIVNHELSGVQERNLERELSCRVVDRVGLILDIFAQRARSAEGKLQVELAQLEHMSTRLVRGWTHLERQKGGIGMRGPGETQLETDRRLLSDRVAMLKERLAKVQRQHQTQRRARKRGAVRGIALVGYTNAGKSTLFNQLTKAHTYAANQLFATLDTTVRRLHVHGAQPIVLSDTVGFVRDLPHDLVAAFRATLQEAVDADLLLHVVDASHPARDEQIEAVEAVLREIGAAELPTVLILNKCDLTGLPPEVQRDEYGKIRAIRLSAATGAGCGAIIQMLAELFPAAAAADNDQSTPPAASSSALAADTP